MRYISIHNSVPGMILARHVWGPRGQILLTANTVLKDSYIQRLLDLQYSAIYIKSYESEPVENLVEPVKQQTLVQAKETLRSIVDIALSSSRIDIPKIVSIVESIVDQVLGNRDVIYNMADIKAFDDYTFGHSVDVCVLSVMCASEMGMNKYELLDLGTGAIMHDMGKLFIPKEILSKVSHLSADDWDVIRQHPWDGFQFLRRQIPLIPAHIALQHHERFDGSGYPRGLEDEAMLNLAKVTAVADSYNAMTSDRPYRRAMMPHQALPIIVREAGRSYNPDVVKAFTRVVAEYPLGSLVRLSDGSTACVSGATKGIYQLTIASGPREGESIQVSRDSELAIIERIE
ncbi:MAG: HD-GYP domain-containing protein [Clostridia bacterium]|nr:HD-GYP domain-containing protein [Clostridia bacterium]